MPTTFPVAEVRPARTPLATCAGHVSVEAAATGPVEACSDRDRPLLDPQLFVRNNYCTWSMHPLVRAVYQAYCEHRPLVLSPDMIWLCIAHGIATHINLNPERWRHYFVNFEGKRRLTVRRDDFVKGSPENPWEQVFDAFDRQLSDFLGKKRDLLVPEFSTTGPVERCAFEVSMMDTVQAFFEYTLLSLCGIPYITLEGESSDWEDIYERLGALRELELDTWADNLEPIIKHFLSASCGRADPAFWAKIYDISAPASGTEMVTGWIGMLFPYLAGERAGQLGPGLRQRRRSRPGEVRVPSIDPAAIPSGLSRAPMNWLYLGTNLEMELLAGFIGVEQDEDTLALRPKIGWAVRDAPAASG